MKWGPTGQTVYERTYSREKPDGTRETWPETVDRVCRGNLSLSYGPEESWSDEVWEEFRDLTSMMEAGKILPAGRHLWASGVPGRQFLFNCHVAGWEDRLSVHTDFVFMRLAEGGGVGANYSTKYVGKYVVKRPLKVHVVCDPEHPDYADLKAAGVLSEEYSPDWAGAFEVEDSREGWSEALTDLLDTATITDQVRHENRVYDVSNVRRKGARLKTMGGRASGPLPLAVMLHEVNKTLNTVYYFNDEAAFTPVDAMDIDHAIGKCVVAGGNRRSARMSIVHWDDPYIADFLVCKANVENHWTTNISVEVDDAFIRALAERDEYAWSVHNAVVAGMLRNGEPGYWNSDTSNEDEPTPVVATNPCGEIALMPWENCNLGHVNLDAFAPSLIVGNHGERIRSNVNIDELFYAHQLMTRFLIRATFGDVNDEKQRVALARNRRIGVGHFGVQGFLAKCGIPYSKAPDGTHCIPGTAWSVESILTGLRNHVRNSARAYAFELRIPEPVKVTTVAPTGTIAKMPGRTEGIHPIYSRYFIRRVRFSGADPEQRDKVIEFWDQGYKVEEDLAAPNTWVVEFPTKEALVDEVAALGLPESLVESADEISLYAMLRFQAMYQEAYADNAVSFTINVLPGTVTESTLADALYAFLPVLKGTTVFPDLSRPQSPYERITREQYEAAVNKSVDSSYDENCASGACPVK